MHAKNVDTIDWGTHIIQPVPKHVTESYLVLGSHFSTLEFLFNYCIALLN